MKLKIHNFKSTFSKGSVLLTIGYSNFNVKKKKKISNLYLCYHNYQSLFFKSIGELIVVIRIFISQKALKTE